MATLMVQTYDEVGSDLTLSSAASGGDQFPNTGQEVIIVKNDDTASTDVTVTAQNTSFDDDVWGDSVKQDQTLTVSSGGGVGILGPFPRRAFNDGSGNVQISYSSVTSLEVAIVKQS